MSKLLFATETIRTSQGWFSAGDLMPADDLPDDETETLLEAKQAGTCHHASPLATAVHAARKASNKSQAAVDLKLALEQLSDEEPDLSDDGDPTPDGEFPSLEIYLKAGYQEATYEEAKRQWYEAKASSEQEPSKPGVPDTTSTAQS